MIRLCVYLLPTTIMTDTLDSLHFRPAELGDASAIACLVNSAYRGDSSRVGWTTEADLLEGTRIHASEVETIIKSEDAFILLCQQGENIIGSVQLEHTDDSAYLGMFVVKPVLQGAGIGKLFMTTAENAVQERWGVKKMWMSVISVREELIAYYERRGYVRTGRFKPFPVEDFDSELLVPELQFEEMEKDLA